MKQEPPDPTGNGPWEYEAELARAYNAWDKQVESIKLLLAHQLLSQHLEGDNK